MGVRIFNFEIIKGRKYQVDSGSCSPGGAVISNLVSKMFIAGSKHPFRNISIEKIIRFVDVELEKEKSEIIKKKKKHSIDGLGKDQLFPF